MHKLDNIMRNKYYKQQLYTSTDGGETWTAMDVYQKGAVYEVEGGDCQPQFRTTSGTPYCQGFDKYVTITREISWDGGETWESASTKQIMVEAKSVDCGYTYPLTFVPQEDAEFRFYYNVYYSLDSGSTWTLLPAWTASPTVRVGEKIMWKANITPSEQWGVGTFVTSSRFAVEGNPMSLLYGDNYLGQTSLSGKDYAFYNLFRNCGTLTSISGMTLPATTLSYRCYQNMFYNCTSLTTVPSNLLPATTLSYGCYMMMFAYCTSLTIAPSLLATTLANSCYFGMFYHCTSLTIAPELSATTLVHECYHSMFWECTSLTTAPELLATTLADYCYNTMFYGCTSLNYIKCMATSISAEDCLYNWVSGVTSGGTFIRDCNTNWSSGDSGIPNNWQDNCSQPTPSYSGQYLTFIATESGTFKFSENSIDYSLDSGSTWTTLASDTDSPTVTSGSKIMWKATLTPNSNIGIGIFSSTSNFIAEGNPMSLLYGDNFSGQTSLSGKDSAFMNLFGGLSTLTSAENLVLPATTLAANCYNSMFSGCTSLTTAPSTLPATTLSGYCYGQMFQGCTSLTTAPSLPATTLAIFCYGYMFNGCTSLTTAPSLPATTLADWCYFGMFYGCTSLSSITCLATDISASNCTAWWVGGVASNGTFTKAASMASWTSGNDGIPTNWTVQDAS